jgi:hypothetical protein
MSVKTCSVNAGGFEFYTEQLQHFAASLPRPFLQL